MLRPSKDQARWLCATPEWRAWSPAARNRRDTNVRADTSCAGWRVLGAQRVHNQHGYPIPDNASRMHSAGRNNSVRARERMKIKTRPRAFANLQVEISFRLTLPKPEAAMQAESRTDQGRWTTAMRTGSRRVGSRILSPFRLSIWLLEMK